MSLLIKANQHKIQLKHKEMYNIIITVQRKLLSQQETEASPQIARNKQNSLRIYKILFKLSKCAV